MKCSSRHLILFVGIVLLDVVSRNDSNAAAAAWTTAELRTNQRIGTSIKVEEKLRAYSSSSKESLREPAGASNLLFPTRERRRSRRPQSVVGTRDGDSRLVRRRRRIRKRVSKFWQARRQRHRRRQSQTLVGQDSSELSIDYQEVGTAQHQKQQRMTVRHAQLEDCISDWACVSDEEIHNLAKMKTLLQPDLERIQDWTVEMNGKEVYVVDAFPDVYGDLRLLRYLRKDAIPNPESAAARYRKFLQWRQDYDVDVVRSHVEDQPFSPPSHLEVLTKLMPCEFNVSSKENTNSKDTIPALLHVGAWDTNSVTELIQQDEMSLSSFLLYWTHMFESLNLKLHREMLERKRMVYIDEIADLKGLSMRHLSPNFVRLVLRPFIQVSQRNYPETTKRIIFLSPPKIISVIWNIVAPMASPGTVAKVQFKQNYEGSCMDFVHDLNRSEE